MRYRLSLGSREINSVISVSEMIRADIEEYQSLNGNSFCEPTARPLRSWIVELLVDGRGTDSGDDDELLEQLREMRDKQKAERLTVSSNVGGFSVRVLLREMKIRAGYGDCAVVSLQLLEYRKAKAKVSETTRAGSIGAPPGNVMSGTAYQLMIQYDKADEGLKVANPDTGAEIGNLAALDPDMILRAEKCIGNLNSTLSKLKEKRNKILSAVYSDIKA